VPRLVFGAQPNRGVLLANAPDATDLVSSFDTRANKIGRGSPLR